MLVYLFGGYARTGITPGGMKVAMRFLSHARAKNYENSFFGGIDPYAGYLNGPIKFIPGKLTRRANKPLWKIYWTLTGFPMQAEGQLEDGRWYYFRYRFGIAMLGIGPTAEAAVMDKYCSKLRIGDRYDGHLEMEEAEAIFHELLIERLEAGM